MYTICGNTRWGERRTGRRDSLLVGDFFCLLCALRLTFTFAFGCVFCFPFVPIFFAFAEKHHTAATYFVNAFLILVYWLAAYCTLHTGYLNSDLLLVMHFFSLFFSAIIHCFFSDGKTTNSECDPTARSHKCLQLELSVLNVYDMLSIIVLQTVLGNANAPH